MTRPRRSLGSVSALALPGAFLLLGLLAGAVIAWSRPWPATEELPFTGSLGDPMVATVHLPCVGSAPHGAVICVQSVFAWRGVGTPMAQEMARHGRLAMTVPLQGYSPQAGRWRGFADYQGDLRAALKALQRRRDVDPSRISLVGQSMGADLACSLAREVPGIRSTIAIGFPVDADRRHPANLLLAVGAWDELHPLAEMRETLARATDGRGDEPSRTYGSFADHTARRLLILPRADHVLENFDADLYREALAWMQAAEGAPGPPSPVRIPYRVMAEGVASLAALGLALWAMALLELPWRRALQGIPHLGTALAPRALFLATLTCVLALGLLHRSWHTPWLHRTILVLLASAMCIDAIASVRADPDEPLDPAWWRAMGRAALLAGVVFAAVVLAVVVNGSPALAWDPSLLLQAPLFAAIALPVNLAATLDRVSGVLFHDVPGTTGLHVATAVLIVTEVAAPGAIVLAASRLMVRLVKALQGLDFRPRVEVTPATGLVLLLCLLAAGLAWTQVFRGGYVLGSDDLLRFGGVLARLVLLPAVLVVVAVRSRTFRRLEEVLSPSRKPQEVHGSKDEQGPV